MKVLIVDDSPVMRKLVERALRATGAEIGEVMTAGNGQEAIDVLRRAEANGQAMGLILSDINMPVMNGLEFVEEVRAKKLAPAVPVVMITTEGSEQLVLRAIAAGARGYICKPFTAEQVKARVLPLLKAAAPRMPMASGL